MGHGNDACLVEEQVGNLSVQGRLEGELQVEGQPCGGWGWPTLELPCGIQVIKECAVRDLREDLGGGSQIDLRAIPTHNELSLSRYKCIFKYEKDDKQKGGLLLVRVGYKGQVA